MKVPFFVLGFLSSIAISCQSNSTENSLRNTKISQDSLRQHKVNPILKAKLADSLAKASEIDSSIEGAITYKIIKNYTDNKLEDWSIYEIKNTSKKTITAIELLRHYEYTAQGGGNLNAYMQSTKAMMRVQQGGNDEVIYKGAFRLIPDQKRRIKCLFKRGTVYVNKIRFDDGTSLISLTPRSFP